MLARECRCGSVPAQGETDECGRPTQRRHLLRINSATPDHIFRLINMRRHDSPAHAHTHTRTHTHPHTASKHSRLQKVQDAITCSLICMGFIAQVSAPGPICAHCAVRCQRRQIFAGTSTDGRTDVQTSQAHLGPAVRLIWCRAAGNRCSFKARIRSSTELLNYGGE